MASKIPCEESQIRLIPVTSFGRSCICQFGENAEVLISERSKFCVLSEVTVQHPLEGGLKKWADLPISDSWNNCRT